MTRRIGYILIGALVSCGAPDPGTEAKRLRAAFDAASAEYDVPREVLEGIAWVETRFWIAPDVEANDHGVGIMHLVDAGPGSPLPEAARLTGLPLEALRTDYRANIRGAAAVLRARADAFFAEHPDRDPTRVEAWWQLVMRQLGSPEASLSESYATEVYRAITLGTSATLDDGSTYVLGSHTVNLRAERMFSTTASLEQEATPDYADAKWRAALRFTAGREGTQIDRVVIHTAQGSYSGTVNWFQNPSVQASAHYVVRSTDVDAPVMNPVQGDVTQMVENRHTAWHAGNWETNLRSIGIEHEGFVKPRAGDPVWYTDAMYRASANLVVWLCDTYGIPKDRAHIIGHYEVPGCASGQGGGSNCHTDPCYFEGGQLKCIWDWSRYMQLVGGTNIQTGTMRGYVFSGANCTVPSTTACTPLQGATVSVPESGASTVTTINGAFEFRLPAGKYNPIATAAGYDSNISYTDSKEPDPARRGRVVTSGGTTWSSFILPVDPTASTIKGLVFERRVDGSTPPISGATVKAGGSTTFTGSDGRFVIVVPAGDVIVVAQRSGFRTAGQTVTARAGGTQQLEFGLEPGGEDSKAPVITFTKPLEGSTVRTAQVEVAGTVDEDVYGIQLDGLAVTVAADRTFSATVTLTAGLNELKAITSDLSNNVGEATLRVTYDATPVVAQGLKGKVVDASTAAPVEGAVVQAGDAYVRSKADGSYELSTPTGARTVQVQAVGYRTREVKVTVPAGAVVPLTIAILPGNAGDLLVITSPVGGAVLLKPAVEVLGTVKLANLATVTIEGAAATVEGESFKGTVTFDTVGAHTITVVATTADGLEATATVNVRYEEEGCGCAAPGPGLGVTGLLLLGLTRRRRSVA